MDDLTKGPLGQRRNRGARERILEAAERLFRDRGINSTGMNELCAVAQVSKRTAYQYFASKDELVAEYLRRQDPEVMPEVSQRTERTPRERLLSAFQTPPGGGGLTPLCPFIGAAVEIADPQHPARGLARDYKIAVAARFSEVAREAGAADPELLGEQLALLLDGASARTRSLGSESMPSAAGIAEALVDRALASGSFRRHESGDSPIDDMPPSTVSSTPLT